MDITFERSTPADVDAILDVRNRCFVADYVRYGECPGYGTGREEMKQIIEDCLNYKILCEGKLIGNISARSRGGGRYWLGCLCVVPEYENLGIGSRAMAFLDEAAPDAVHWSLETPADKLRNHHFYGKHGYAITGRHKEGSVEIVHMERTRHKGKKRKRLAGFCLTTKNVTAQAEFYCKVLDTTCEGNDIHRDVHTEGAGFAIYNDGQVAEGVSHNFYFTFDVEDVDAEHRRLLSLGVVVLQPPTTQPWGMRNMIFADPEGNRVVFRSRPPVQE